MEDNEKNQYKERVGTYELRRNSESGKECNKDLVILRKMKINNAIVLNDSNNN